MMRSDDELEALRVRLLSAAKEAWADAECAGGGETSIEDFAPGTAGAHEALHAAYISREMVGDHVAAHPAVLLKAEWFRAAARAADALNELYLAIGAEHQAAAAAAVREEADTPAPERTPTGLAFAPPRGRVVN